MPIIDYSKAIAPQNDRANKYIVQRRNARTIQLAMFAETKNASWASDRALKIEGYPIATLNFQVNRNAFLLEVGDQFIFNYPHWGVKGMVCRVLRISEEDVESGKLNIQAMEDIDELSQETFGSVQEGKWPIQTQDLGALENVGIIEAPYALSGDAIRVVPLASKKNGSETGFYVYMSFDAGISYQKIGTIYAFPLYGTLAEAYPETTYNVDEVTDGFIVDFDVQNIEDLDTVQTITRDQMIAGQNLALLGNEIISFKTATPITTTRYRISGIYRGRYDTDPEDHPIGDSFWFGGTDLFILVSNGELALGGDRKFKMIPFNNRTAGDISAAIAIDHIITGRALKPYPVGNLLANNSSIPEYKDDIVLTWSSRYRGEPAGIGNPQRVVGDTPPTVEFSFTIEVYKILTLIRTITDIDDITYNYDFDTNYSDNGGLAKQLTFKIKQVRSVNLSSDVREITINHNWRYAINATVQTGTDFSGDFGDTFERDGALWIVREVSGTPGLVLDFLYDGVPQVPLRLFMKAYYDGSVPHSLKLQQYNYTLAQWDNVTTETKDFPTRLSLREYYFNLLQGSDYFNGNQLELRFYLSASGVASHEFHIDFMSLDTQQRLYKWEASTTTSSTTTSSSSSSTTTTTA